MINKVDMSIPSKLPILSSKEKKELIFKNKTRENFEKSSAKYDKTETQISVKRNTKIYRKKMQMIYFRLDVLFK